MATEQQNFDISICIATFQRPQKLARLLHSLAVAVKNCPAAVEIIVVDNDSRKSAAQVVAQFGCNHSTVQYLVEPRQNISHARNLGVSRANGKWFAFVDDDEIVAENWLQSFWLFKISRPADGYFGPVLPRLEQVAPVWFDAELFFFRPRFTTGKRLQEKMRTGNAFISHQVFSKQKFDPKFGLSGGGDTAFFESRAQNGACFLWNDEAVTYEFYPLERTKMKWLIQRYFRSGLAYSKIRIQKNRRWLRAKILSKACIVILFLLLSLMFRFAQSPARGVLNILRICLQVGHIAACFNLNYYEYKNNS